MFITFDPDDPTETAKVLELLEYKRQQRKEPGCELPHLLQTSSGQFLVRLARRYEPGVEFTASQVAADLDKPLKDVLAQFRVIGRVFKTFNSSREVYLGTRVGPPKVYWFSPLGHQALIGSL